MNHFPNISLLITHYNRSNSLGNLLRSLVDLNCTFGEIVVADDGSVREHAEHLFTLQHLFDFKIISSTENKGLGNNLNKGQDAVTKDYTLYIQEDFEPSPLFPSKLNEALTFMERDTGLDYIRFFAYSRYPYLIPFESGFSKMLVKPFGLNYQKIYYYSDHPHLRRSSFFSKFGRYAEGIKGDRTEYRMCVSFIQNGGRGLFYDDYQQLFTQKNTESEPSTMVRQSWRQNNFFMIKIARDVYRHIKYNTDILVMKTHKNTE